MRSHNTLSFPQESVVLVAYALAMTLALLSVMFLCAYAPIGFVLLLGLCTVGLLFDLS